AAHRAGIRTTSTMMFGHVETAIERTRHIALIRSIQRETRGFTEFVPLNFVHDEAPLGAREELGARPGAGAPELLLTHAIARIMLAGEIDNIQMSWVKDGPAVARVLLHWGANDFGGTLINESISTSAGSAHGQLMRPAQIRRAIREAGRVPAQRLTDYAVARRYPREADSEEGALDAAPEAGFGSYAELVKIAKWRYGRPGRA
ncbi:MAG: 7,8-didemethyl-8-hydroxy-5-deazariboflavin synthase subunit CofH, partial [Thaumarchaeota archaeon]|nr:7,8-didemethyl-8-hydroxy-5-deazariboflavin synthase subunit CofH [Nitrososphaerota archaeon]